MKVHVVSRMLCAILCVIVWPQATGETVSAPAVPDADLLKLFLPREAKLAELEDGTAAVEIDGTRHTISATAPDAREDDLAALAVAVEALKDELTALGLSPLDRAATATILDRLPSTDPGDPTSEELTPPDARLLVAHGWLQRIFPDSAAAAELHAATRRCTALEETYRLQVDTTLLRRLASAFGDGVWVAQRDDVTRYARRLPAPAYYPDARSLLLVVELVPGATLTDPDQPVPQESIHATDVRSIAGEFVAEWTEEDGFRAYEDEWREVYPELEGAALPGMLPPHVLILDPDGAIRRLITRYGQLTPATSGDDDEVLRFTSEAAAALAGPAHLDLLGQFLFHYVLDSPDPARPQLIGAGDAAGEIHQTVAETLATTTAGICRGDCDDLAELYHTVASKQGHLCHIMAVPAHNALCWAAREAADRWIAYVLHTGVPLAFPGNDLADAIETAYGLFIDGETFDTDSVPIALRFAGENQRDTWLLSERIFSERDYAETMIDVQRDWHYMTYFRGIVKMQKMLQEGDRHPANYKELAGLASRTGQHALAALCHETGLLVDPVISPETQVRLLGEYLEAGDLVHAAELTETLIERELPTAKVCMDEMEYRDLVLQVAATLIVTGDRADQGAALLVAEVATPLEEFIGRVGRWMRGSKFNMTTWEQGTKPMKLREHVAICSSLVTACLRDADLRQQVDSATIARMRKPLDAWFERVAFQHPLGSADLLGNYGQLGELLLADTGWSQFERALGTAPAPDPAHDHAARRADAQGQELAWINASPSFWSAEVSWVTRDEAKALDHDRFLKLCEHLERAYSSAHSLGLEDYAFDQAQQMARLPQALVAGDAAAARDVLAGLARRGDKWQIDAAVSWIGSLARFLEPDWFAEVLRIWHDEVGTKPSYFGIAWAAYRTEAPQHAILAGEAGVRAFPDETAFVEELANLRRLAAGEDASGMQIPLPDTAWWQAGSDEGAEPIQGRGTHLVLPPGWSRAPTSPGGRDKFFLEPDVWAIVYEVEGCLESAADFEISGDMDFLDEDDQIQEETPITFHPRIDGELAHRYYTSEGDDDIELFWSVNVVARDGLGIMVVVWSSTDWQEDVLRNAPRLLAGIRFPAPDTDWGRAAQPARLEGRSAGMTFSVEHTPSLLPAVEGDALGDAILGLRAAGGAVSFYVLTGRSSSAESMLDGTASMLARSNDDLERLRTTTVTIAGREALRTDTRFATRGRSAALFAVPLRGNEYLDLRFFTRGTLESRREILDGLLSSLTIEVPPPVVAFPDSPPAPATERWSKPWQQLVAASETVAELDGWPAVALLNPGEVLVAREDGLDVLSLATGRTRALELGDTRADLEGAVTCDGVVYALGSDDGVLRLGEQGWEQLTFAADAIASAGERGLVIARQPAPERLLGLTDLPVVAPWQLLLHTTDGAESAVATLPPDRQLVGMAVDGGARHVLTCSTDSIAVGDTSVELRAFDIETGEEAGRWNCETISRLATARDGWLFAGEVEHGSWGLYELAIGGQPRPLVHTRGVSALDPGGEELIVFALPPAAASCTVLRVPREVARRLGPACQPFDSPRLRTLARETFAATGLEPSRASVLGDRAGLDRLASAARRIAEAAGTPLPSGDLTGTEGILRATVDTRVLGEEGLLLEAALAAEGLLALGAEWVAAAAGGQLDSAHVPGLPIKNLHAVAYSPLDWVDSQTHWTSLRSIRDAAAGRKILLGIDPITLAARASELDAGPGDAATGSPGDLTAFLTANADNLFLRKHVYDQLAAHGRLAVLHQVATAMAGRTDPPALADDRARLAAAVALRQDGDDYEPVVEDLKAAIARHGSTTSTFHLLLGQVYEHGDEPRAKDLARACYSHVARTSDDEELASAARAGLERLGD